MWSCNCESSDYYVNIFSQVHKDLTDSDSLNSTANPTASGAIAKRKLDVESAVSTRDGGKKPRVELETELDWVQTVAPRCYRVAG